MKYNFYPLSFACTSAPCRRSNWTQRIRLKPAAKCNGVDLRPSLAWQLTLRGVKRADNLVSSPERLDSRIYKYLRVQIMKLLKLLF